MVERTAKIKNINQLLKISMVFTVIIKEKIIILSMKINPMVSMENEKHINCNLILNFIGYSYKKNPLSSLFNVFYHATMTLKYVLCVWY